MGLSIGGLATYVVGICCGPLALIGVGLCGAGAYMGTKELQDIDAGIADPAGRSYAKGAQITGGIGVGLFLLGIVMFVVFLGIGSLA